jgi:hypothetical protein
MRPSIFGWPERVASIYRSASLDVAVRFLICMLATMYAFYEASAQQRNNDVQIIPPARQPAPAARHRPVILYPPGDLKGTPFDTLENCNKAIERNGNVGICVIK